MLRPVCTVVALMLTCTACGSANEAEPQAEPTSEISTTPNQRADSTTAPLAPTTLATTTTLAPTTTGAPTTVVPTEPPEPTIYRPEPIWEGDQVTATIQPVDGVALDNSSVTIRIVEFPDGRFLQVDLTNAVVPAGSASWITEVNGRLKLQTTPARQGSTQVSRVDRAVYGDSFVVCFSATTAEGQVLATTGDIQISV